MDREGPTTIHNVKSFCTGCRHFAGELITPGEYPKYNYFCLNDDAPKSSLCMKEQKVFIGTTKDTPDWCPLKTKK